MGDLSEGVPNTLQPAKIIKNKTGNLKTWVNGDGEESHNDGSSLLMKTGVEGDLSLLVLLRPPFRP